MDVHAYKLFFRALSNETRFRIVELLFREGPKSVKEICENLGFEQSRVSHNLKCLVACGFVNVKQDGKSRIYSLDDSISMVIRRIDQHLKKYGKRLESCGILRGKKTCRWIGGELTSPR